MDARDEQRLARLSTVEEIRARFDGDVERFSSLELGQQALPDSPQCMAMVARTAGAVRPNMDALLDVGCGAGNYTIALLRELSGGTARPSVDCDLMDLSGPMLDRAEQRVSAESAGRVTPIQSDVRDAALDAGRYDVVMAAAVLHHLRGEAEWRAVYAKLRAALKPGGRLFVVDMVEQESPELQRIVWNEYGRYLAALRDDAYRDEVFAYIAKEDSPRPLVWQLDIMREAGFRGVEVLHKRLVTACFCGRA